MPTSGRPRGFPEVGSGPLDVAVIGGGPAGAAAAITMAREGLRVGVLDRAGRHLPKVGETLPPRAASVLQDLGVWGRFRTDDHLPSYGNRSAWGTPQVQEYDFILDVHGRGWHLDRGRFDWINRGCPTPAAPRGQEIRAAMAPRPGPVPRLSLSSPIDDVARSLALSFAGASTRRVFGNGAIH
jgi:choline dehydrogenase-like flavoprotein